MERIKISFSLIDGRSFVANPLSTDSLRSALLLAKLTIIQSSYMLCLLNKKPLQLDLSLSYQGVRNFDTVTVLYKHLIPSYDLAHLLTPQWFYHLPNEEEDKRQKEMFDEAIRVSDVSFFILDSTPSASITYQNMYEGQIKQSEKSQYEETPVSLKIPQKSLQPRIDPLPKCFGSMEGRHGQGSGFDAMEKPLGADCSGYFCRNPQSEWRY